MATSGSYDFNLTRNDLIKDSFSNIGMGVDGEVLRNEYYDTASRKLNMMLKAWSNRGVPLWKKKSQSITLTAGKSSYSLGPTGDIVMQRPLAILSAVRRDTNNIDVPLIRQGYDEYWEMPNKSTNGTPVNYFYDKQTTNGVLYLWQQPGTTEAAEYTIEIVYSQPIEDMDIGVDDFDMPQEWYEAISWNLSSRLAAVYGIEDETYRRVKKMAETMLEDAEGWDVEDSSIFIRPDHRMR